MVTWVKIIVYAFLLLFLLLGIAIGVDIWEFRSGSTATTGEILSIREEYSEGEDGDGRSTIDLSYYATVRFTDQNRVEYKAEVEQPVLNEIPKIGDQIAIRYFRDNPGWVRPDYGFWRDWLVAVGIIAVSFSFLLITHFALRRKVPEI